MRSDVGADNPSALLDEDEVEQIRRERVQGRKFRELASDHGVSESCVKNICSGRTWRHLDPNLMELAIRAGARQPRGPSTRSPDDVRDIRERCAKGESRATIAADHKLTVAAVTQINTGRRYASVK